jgi:hypothetical protein
MLFADEFDAVLAQQPGDWAYFECFLTVEDPRRLTDARVSLARANARPVRTEEGHDFEITVANTQGRGATAGVVRSALRILDDLGIAGRVWCGQTYDMLRPAPAHRFGP